MDILSVSPLPRISLMLKQIAIYSAAFEAISRNLSDCLPKATNYFAVSLASPCWQPSLRRSKIGLIDFTLPVPQRKESSPQYHPLGMLVRVSFLFFVPCHQVSMPAIGLPKNCYGVNEYKIFS